MKKFKGHFSGPSTRPTCPTRPTRPTRPIKLGASLLGSKGYHWTPGGTLWLLCRVIAKVPEAQRLLYSF